MAFVDVPNAGSKITEVDTIKCDENLITLICDSDNHMSSPYLTYTMLALVYGYQIFLAYQLADGPNRKLRFLKAMLYIPLSIVTILRFAIGACVISYIITSYIRSNARAPSVERECSTTNENVTFSTGRSYNNEENQNRERSEHPTLIDLELDELSEVITIPDPNRSQHRSG
jgi:hypothetical protein